MTTNQQDQGSNAIISACGKYRYRLERDCPGEGATAVIMVNPSTADGAQDDATIRKLKGFGQRHGWGKIIVGNLFAFRATDVRELSKTSDPVGPDNGYRLAEIFLDAERVIFAWGPLAKQPKYQRGRWREVWKLAQSMHSTPLCIGEPCGDGHPRHPLMLAYDSPIQPWNAP